MKNVIVKIFTNETDEGLEYEINEYLSSNNKFKYIVQSSYQVINEPIIKYSAMFIFKQLDK